jgi:hypothetical protein
MAASTTVGTVAGRGWIESWVASVGQCVVCMLVQDAPTSPAAVVCRTTCAREANAEARRLSGRLHQLRQLTRWHASARLWEVARHPRQHRKAAVAQQQITELTDRQQLLIGAVTRWNAEHPAPVDTDHLAPRDVRLAGEAIVASFIEGAPQMDDATLP